MSQALSIQEHHLVVFVRPEIYYAKKTFSNKVMIYRIHQAGLRQPPGDHETLSITRHVGLHVDFPSMKSSLGF
jgi:hypothetical protein